MRSSPFFSKLRSGALLCLLLHPVLALAQESARESIQPSRWIVTWAASPQPVELKAGKIIEDQTVRERVRVSLGGAQIRLRLSNEYGSAPLLVGSVTIGIPNGPAGIVPDSLRTVNFSGQGSVTIAANALVLSDPVSLSVAPGTELSVSLYFPNRLTTATLHALALKRAVVSEHGDHTHDVSIEGAASRNSSISLTAVLVPAPSNHRLVVAFGDSVTDGDGSTPETDRNWPSDLIRRLSKTPQASKVAVVNAGIVANRLLSDCSLPAVGCLSLSALARFDRDVLSLPAVTHVIVFEGVNDIGFPGAVIEGQSLAPASEARTASDLIAAYLQLIARAHARGVRIIGATITPFEGVDVPGYYSESKEAVRQAVNKWIRTSGSFDGVIDFDAVLRDSNHPSRLSPAFASEDHLHPNDAGYQAMADAIDLTLFQ
jgi:lysophospholipase L1-like esterase